MKQLFLIFAFLIGYSLTASAEKIKLVPSAGDSTRMDTVVISELSDADAYAPTDTHSNTNSVSSETTCQTIWVGLLY